MDYISFPKLGWEFPLSDTLLEFTLFGQEFTIKWYGVLIAVGFLLAMIYALTRIKDFDLDPDRMIDVVLVSTLFAFLGARLYYVFFSDQVSEYLADPIRILYVWEGGLGIYGGIIMAFVTGIWMCKLRKVNTWAMFDMAAMGFLIGQGIGRWGNFFNQEAFGGNTELPWGMSGSEIAAGVSTITDYDTALPVHPTFLYESLWCLLGFVLLHIISKKAYSFKGELFSLYLIWYGAGRFCIESLRTDSLYLGTMKVSQLVAVLAMIGGIVTFIIRRNRSRETSKDLFAGERTLTLDSDIAENVTEEAMEEAVEELDEAPVEEILVEESTEAPVEEPAVEELAETSDTDKE